MVELPVNPYNPSIISVSGFKGSGELPAKQALIAETVNPDTVIDIAYYTAQSNMKNMLLFSRLFAELRSCPLYL